MKERSKERMAELLLQELFEQLGERENVKRMLGDMSSMPLDEVVGQLVGDIEQLVARRRTEALDALRGKAEPFVTQKSNPPALPGTSPLASPLPPKPAEPISFPVTISPPVPQRVEVPPPAEVRSKAEPPAKVEPVKSPAKQEVPQPPAREADPVGSTFWGDIEKELKGKQAPEPKREEEKPVPPAKPEPVVPRSLEEAREEEAEEAGEEEEGADIVANASELRTPAEFTDDDIVYLHGLSLIPENQPHEPPFMLEEKGIDPRGFVFTFDYEGMRLYLSKVLPNVMNISKTGMLLLGKQESLQLQGAHESILNDLRMHGVILPFRFGIIPRGRDDLMGRVDEHKSTMMEALEALHATKWWLLNLQVLDARIAQVVGSDAPPPVRKGRMVERTSYSKMPMPKKYDIKMLERMLHREKRLAESVHEELKTVADRADIDEIVGLGSGSSEEWKSILKASYEIQPRNVMKFYHAVTDLQYRHLMFDLMLSVSGDGEAYSFDGN